MFSLLCLFGGRAWRQMAWRRDSYGEVASPWDGLGLRAVQFAADLLCMLGAVHGMGWAGHRKGCRFGG